METMLELPPTATGRKRWSRPEVDFLENAGLLRGRYELIDGEIISKMGQNPPHAVTVMRVIAYLLRSSLLQRRLCADAGRDRGL